MKSKIILLVGLVAICLWSCTSPEKKKAKELSETLSVINDSLAHRGKAFAEFLSAAVRDKQFDKIAAARQSYEDYIDSCGRFVKHIEDVAGSEQLRRSELAVLGFDKHMVNIDLALFDSLTPQTDPARISGLFAIAQKDAQKESEFISKFKEIQEEYAKRNGF